VHRTGEQALRAELTNQRRLLSCVTPQVLQLLPPSGELRTVTLGAEPVKLRGGLELTVDQWLRTVQHPDRGGWRTEVAGYAYAFDAEGQELIAFHWHPGRASRHDEPHLHPRGPLAKRHVPTGGPVTLVQVLRFAITDLGVEPIRTDWARQIALADEEEANAGLGLQGPLDVVLESEGPDDAQ
jgi:hypothetical protein